MPEKSEREKSSIFQRKLVILAGVGLITLSLLALLLGLGKEGTIDFGSLIILILGSIFMLIGILGKSFKEFYQGMSIILVNTIAFLIILELIATVIAHLGFFPDYVDVAQSRYLELPYYREQVNGLRHIGKKPDRLKITDISHLSCGDIDILRALT
jgi:hypothetical protein